MIKRRKNFSEGSYQQRVEGTFPEMYKKWHWGKAHTGVIELKDKDYPENLVECGRLVEFTYRDPRQNPKHKDKMYKLNSKDSNVTHLVFDPKHPNERLYIGCTNPSVKSKIAKDLYAKNDYVDVPLSDMSYFAPGRHSADDYPSVEAKVLGVLTSIVYACEKIGDGYSFYVHQMGEESGLQPLIAVDKEGRLWVVGGNYSVPIQGITD